ncbi:MAG: LLM class flavin-dependent oxidoreductase, partial [Actinomycetota bacterium]|nr:LLM class flavin-dependent oxidoreductase [Actinomycetota bacterium]
LLRQGSVNYTGEYHSAAHQINTPRGPQGGRMPLMLAGHGPRTMGLAVSHADIWSGFATTSSEPGAFASMMDLFNAVCTEQGRDPDTIGRSVGIDIHPPGASDDHGWGLGSALRGSVDELVTKLAEFADLGFTSFEIVVVGHTTEAIERLAPVVAAAKDI